MARIDDELTTFVGEGQSIHVATCDSAGRPCGARGVAALVDADREHVDVYIPDVAFERLQPALEASRQLAVVFGRPRDDRSSQLKGVIVSTRQAQDAERAAVRKQWDGFMSALDGIGISRRLAGRWTWWPAHVVRIRVTAIFEQTPGPKAGAQLA